LTGFGIATGSLAELETDAESAERGKEYAALESGAEVWQVAVTLMVISWFYVAEIWQYF
jgi:hypothetical protein